MISQRGQEKRRGRPPKMAKNVDRLYKEGKCRDCSVLVTRMDFAKILGKFTKVKIQYESSTTPKTKKTNETTGNSTSRLKKSENGMVLHNKNANNVLPNTPTLNSKKPKITKPVTVASPRQGSNILKENNRLKKSPIMKDKNSNYNQRLFHSNLKQYGIIFINPNVIKTNDVKSKATLLELLPDINKSILPNEEWVIDYFPKNEEPKEDKVYDRIAAELEDLMYTEKTTAQDKTDASENKVDEFPSIMDILNESTSESISKSNDQSSTEGFKSNLESSDVEAMLLGKSSTISKETDTIPMDVDNTDMATLIANVPLDAIQDPDKNEESEKQDQTSQNSMVNLSNPSIIDETLRKGIEEQLPCDNQIKDCLNGDIKNNDNVPAETAIPKENDTFIPKTDVITHVIFKQTKNGKCYRCVTCPKNLKYSIELDGKAVEFIGAPKFISSLEDLEVLLQIVNESHLESLYVLH